MICNLSINRSPTNRAITHINISEIDQFRRYQDGYYQVYPSEVLAREIENETKRVLEEIQDHKQTTARDFAYYFMAKGEGLN